MMGIPLRVLIIEDSASDAQLITRLLQKGGYDVTATRVETAEQVRSSLGDRPFDLVLSDYNLPRLDGQAAFRVLQESGVDIPFIIVSGAIGEENAVELMKMGVSDYIMKGNLARLVPAIERELAQAASRREGVRAAAALREANERYQMLAQVSPVGVFNTDAHGSTTYVNPGWCRISGWSVAEAMGDRWLASVHPDDREHVRLGWEEAMQGGRTSIADYRFVRPDGSIVWVMGQAVPQRNADGVIIGYVGTVTDITERKIAERKLRESEEKYRLLMEHSGAGVGFYDTNGILLYFNKRAARALNGAPEDFVGRSLEELFGREQAELYVERIRTAAQTDTLAEFEDQVPMPAGNRWFLSSYARVLDANGEVVGVQIVSQDITSRKQAELAVRQSEREIRMLHESMRDGFVSTDMQGHILSCNTAYSDLLGYSRDELRRLRYHDFTPAEWLPVDEAMIREQAIPRGYSDVYEKEYKTKSGRVVPVELRVLLLRNESGQPAGMWAVVRDITERKRIEAAVRENQQATEAILNSLTSHIAVVDETGTIIAVNDAWLRFASQEGIGDISSVGIGANYFEACRKAVAQDRDEIARNAMQGITDVIASGASRYYIEYPCHSPETQRWFTMHVSRITGERIGAVIAHENITERKLAELRIQELADQLRRLSSHLEAAREEERLHIAREIHDELGQALTALKMDLTDIHRHASTLPDKVNERLAIMGGLIDRTAQTVQRLAGELRPPMLDELGLVAALGWYIQDFEERFGIACTRVRFDDPPRSDRSRATALYRVLQECLTNVARHSGATEVELRLAYADETVLLEVRDNGRGITNEEMKKLNSHGILGMHERLQGYDGALDVQGSDGRGTTVRARMPWPTR